MKSKLRINSDRIKGGPVLIEYDGGSEIVLTQDHAQKWTLRIENVTVTLVSMGEIAIGVKDNNPQPKPEGST